MPDERALAYPDGDLWRDWSDEAARDRNRQARPIDASTQATAKRGGLRAARWSSSP